MPHGGVARRTSGAAHGSAWPARGASGSPRPLRRRAAPPGGTRTARKGKNSHTGQRGKGAGVDYAASFGAGLVVGIMYGLLRVPSPAPPFVCLVGLAGILVGYTVPEWIA
nr:DUF1427 family protein [Streptomyces sp. SID8377]